MKYGRLVAFAPLMLVLAVSGRPAGAQAPDGSGDEAIRRILVLDVAVQGGPEFLSRTLTDAVAYAVRTALPEAAVLSQADVRSVLALEAQKQLMGCEDVGCLTDLAGAMGADHVVTARLGILGSVRVLDFTLIQVAQTRVVRQRHDELQATDDERLLEAARQLGASVVDPLRPAGLGRVAIGGVGEVSVDGRVRGPAPLQGLYLEPGSHTVSWFRRGLWTPPKPIYVESYGRLRVDPESSEPLVTEHPDLESDLGGLIALGGIGYMASALGQDDRDAGGDILQGLAGWFKFGWSVEDQLHVYGRCVLYEGAAEGPLGGSLGSAGGGACAAGGAFDVGGREHFNLFLGAGPIWQQASAERIPDGAAFQLELGGEMAYAITRYLEVGASAAYHLAFSGDVLPAYSLGIYVGIPSERVTGMRPRDWRTDPTFWVAAITVAAATGFTVWSGAQQALR